MSRRTRCWSGPEPYKIYLRSVLPLFSLVQIQIEIEGKELKVVQTLQEQLSDFFGALVESQNPTPANETFSNNTHTAGISFSKTARAAQMIHSSRAISRQTSFMGLDPKAQQPDRDRVERDKDKDERGFEAEILMGRHVEQCELSFIFVSATERMSRAGL